MEDLSLHILDIVENCIRAGAKKVEIRINEDLKKDLLEIKIHDDGCGMDQTTIEKATDPFFTTKSVRKVGLGLSLIKQAARIAGGDLCLSSKPGKGTVVKATFQHSHVDRQPLGDIAETLMILIISNPEVHFRYFHWKNGREYQVDSKQLTDGSKESPNTFTKQMDLIKKNLESVRCGEEK